MKAKTNTLTGIPLNYIVAVCEKVSSFLIEEGYCQGGKLVQSGKYDWPNDCYIELNYSTDWAQGGPILSREHISRTIDHSGLWIAYWTDGYTEGDEGKKWMQCDRSELVAGLRCYVASKLGEEVDVPEELMK